MQEMAKFGVRVPWGRVASTPDEAEAVFAASKGLPGELRRQGGAARAGRRGRPRDSGGNAVRRGRGRCAAP